MKGTVNDREETDGQGRNGTGQTGPAAIAAAAIRERSSVGDLFPRAELDHLLNEARHQLPEGDMPTFVARLVRENGDIRELSGGDGDFYLYSDLHMTGAYAEILLHRRNDPRRLIAATVRQNSRECGRPIALEIFMESPFHLEAGAVHAFVATMAATAGYEDIATVTTSAAGIYLYSTADLEEGHAAMLAEWFDVGQNLNP
ncbi:MAG: hypothetical protein WC405_16730 [Syntrophales bacterium]